MDLNETLTNITATITAVTALLAAIKKLINMFFDDDETRKG